MNNVNCEILPPVVPELGDLYTSGSSVYLLCRLPGPAMLHAAVNLASGFCYRDPVNSTSLAVKDLSFVGRGKTINVS